MDWKLLSCVAGKKLVNSVDYSEIDLKNWYNEEVINYWVRFK